MAVSMNELSKKVFDDRYALKNDRGEQLEKTPEEMWRRVANSIASVEWTDTKRQHWADQFYNILEDFKYVPGGRVLTGAGTGVNLTYYNCYVIPSPEDSRSGIFDNVRTMVEIMSRGGGVGVNLSTLRPAGSYVKGVNGTASGAVSFGGLYSYATGLIIQGGSRRGALMLMLDDNHPDIEEFITVKRTMGLVTNANLSVCISDKFMEAVKNDADWNLEWQGKVYKTVKANYLWNLICESAWASGEPGAVFMERYNKESNSWYFEKIICVNPCGEQGLGAWGVCNLGAVNLSAFVKEGKIDYENLGKTVRTAVRFMDNVIDATPYLFEDNRKAQMGTRRIGLGTMGLGDMLIKMKLKYGSPAAVELCDEVYKFIRDESYWASVDIAREKGSFPHFEREKFREGKFIKRLPEELQTAIYTYGIRNCFLLTQAPTGTTSILAGVSSGIEPVYDFVVIRKDRLGEHEMVHPLYQEWRTAHPDEPLPEYFTTAKALSPEEHVVMQAVAQKYTDSSISKTVNAPNAHTIEEVKTLYQKAYDLGCKGVTYYRDGSRDVSVLTSKSDVDKKKQAANEPPEIKEMPGSAPAPRPSVTSGSTYKIKTGYGSLFVTVNNDDRGLPFEVFATVGKTGGFFAAKSEAICRLVSLALRSGVDAQHVIEQLRGIRGPMPSFSEYGQVLSIPDAISKILDVHTKGVKENISLMHEVPTHPAEQAQLVEPEVLKFEEVKSALSDEHGMQRAVATKVAVAERGFAPECPNCSSVLNMSEGCMTCPGCGFSKCG